MKERNVIGPPRLEALRAFVEQAGAPSGVWGVRDPSDWLERVLPGVSAKLRVAGDDELDGLNRLKPFIEQLGVASGKELGLLRDRDGWKMALMGLSSKWNVARYWGTDVRQTAYEAIERWVIPLPMSPENKATLLAVLYTTAKRLPDWR